MVNIKRNEPG